MNSKSWFLILLICALMLSALLARSGDVLLLAVPLLVYSIIGILQSPVDLTLRARRIVDKSETTAQEPVQIEVVVENLGGELPNLLLADALPRSVQIVDGQPRQRLALSAGKRAQLVYTASAARGVYPWNAVHASAGDPFGLFELQRDIPAFAEIRIRPAGVKLRHVPIRPRSTLHAPGPTPARLAGPGTDFWGIREYRTGDSLRRINWRLAGRYPRHLFTNEFEGEEIGDFGLILDARRLANAYPVEETLFESSVSAAAALSEAFLKKGNRVALLVFGETTSCLFPGYGKRQLNLVMHDLARAQLGRNLPLQYLEYFPVRVFPTRSVIVVFSALDARDLETYARLRAHGYDVLLISPDPVEPASKMMPSTEVSRLAVRAARLERAIQLKALMKMGVEVVDWQVDQPLDALLQRTAVSMAHRRNI